VFGKVAFGFFRIPLEPQSITMYKYVCTVS
jgi:hypothetical protein